MKNFETILSENGVTMTEEQKTAVTAAVNENYKPIADWQKQVDKVKNLEETVKTTEDALKKFEGVDLDAVNKQVEDLKADLANREAEYQKEIAERDFHDDLKEAIAKANGKNAKAITALLDLEKLKASKNRKDDIAADLKTLAEAEDSNMLFGEVEETVADNVNFPGKVGKGSSGETTTLRDALREKYKK